MVTASFTGLLKTIFWIIIIYYAIKFLVRIFAPMLLQQAVKKATQNMYEQQQQYNNQQQQSYSSNTTTNTNTNTKPHEKKKVGEYIDFEEIE